MALRNDFSKIAEMKQPLIKSLTTLEELLNNYIKEYHGKPNYLPGLSTEDRPGFIAKTITLASSIGAYIGKTSPALDTFDFPLVDTLFKTTMPDKIKSLKENLNQFILLDTVSEKNKEDCQLVITQLDQLQKLINDMKNPGQANQVNAANTLETKEEGHLKNSSDNNGLGKR